MDKTEKIMVEKAFMFVAIFYGPYFLESSATVKVPSNYLRAFKVNHELREIIQKLEMPCLKVCKDIVGTCMRVLLLLP